ncbi:MAG: hypothetical protein OER90_08970 [Gemmatimonadota bacterium]|nr:hypothetical protein [Gemmatimonadota bacterium]
MRAVAALVAGLVGAQSLAAQAGSRLWRPDERVVISDFSHVEAIGVGRDVVYVVTTEGIGMYDRLFRRWEPPITGLEGFQGEAVFTALVDPLDRSLWMGTMSGLVHYDPVLRLFERTFVPGGVGELLFDRDDAFRGLYFRGRSRWQFLPRGMPIPSEVRTLPPASSQIRSGNVDQVLRGVPHVASRAPFLLGTRRLRGYRFTAAGQAPDNDDVYLGTDGVGVFEINIMGNAEPLPFGVLSPNVGSVVVAEGGVWTATGRGASRTGFTFVSQDAQRYQYDEGAPATGFSFRAVVDLIEYEDRLWAATDAGVVAVRPGERAERMAAGVIAQSNGVLALASSAAGVWVGTERGLYFVADDGEAHRVDARVVTPILALAASGDSVWVGGTAGLGLTWRDADVLIVTPDVANEPELQQPIVALAIRAETLVAATPERLVWRAPHGEWLVERVLTGELGDLTSLAADGDGVWIGGERGVAFYRFGSRAFQFYNAPGDLPGRVSDLDVDDRYLWVATDRGLVRFTKGAMR